MIRGNDQCRVAGVIQEAWPRVRSPTRAERLVPLRRVLVDRTAQPPPFAGFHSYLPVWVAR